MSAAGVDIAQLGLEVRSDGIVVSTKRLKELGDAANDAETATSRLQKQAEKASKSMQKLGKGMQSAGRNMSMYVTAPILAFGAASVAAFASFDDAMTSSLAIMGEVSDSMKKDMANAAREMAKTTQFSATEAAESYYFLASAGLDAAASIAALPKVAAFAQAGVFGMATATDILTDAQSALGKVMEDPIENMNEMGALSDVLVRAATLANASVQQFGESLTNKAGAAMKSLNIDVEEGVAILAAYADQGIKSTEAGEKFNIVTRDLQTAIRKNAEVFKQQEIAVFNSEGGLRNMADIIGDLERKLAPMSIEMQGTTLAMLGFQDRSVIAIRQLIGMSEKIREYEKELRKAGGTTADVAANQMESFKNQLGLVKAEIADVAIEVGGTLAPAVSSIAADVKGVAEAFRNLTPETQQLILKMSILAAIIGPLLIVLGSMVRTLGFLAGAMASAAGMQAAGALMVALRGLIALLTGPVGLAVALGVLVKLIGDSYVKSIEDAILSTTKFKALLSGGDITGLERNLLSVNEMLDSYIQKQKDAQAELERLQSTAGDPDMPGSANMMAGIKAGEQKAELEQIQQEIEHLIQLRDSYTARIRDAIEAAKEEAEVMEEVAEVMEEVAGDPAIVKLTKEEAAALQSLKDELNPAAKAMRELAAARELFGKALETGDLSPEEYERWIELLETATPTFNTLTDTLEEFREVNADIASELQENFEFLEELSFQQQVDEMQAMIDALAGGAEAWEEYQLEMFKAQEVAKLGPDATEEQIAAIEELAEEIFNLQNSAQDMGSAFEEATQEWVVALGDLAGMYAQDSAEAEALNTIIQALNIVLGVQAVIKQLAEGDVYSAIPRALAVAGMIASMGISTGASGSAASAVTPQEAQGTGTVLGDAMEKSESLLKASEITADATSELVGINRGMLNALQNLQRGLGGAAVQLAQGSGDINFGALPDPSNFVTEILTGAGIFNLFGLNFVGEFLNKILGGKTKILDEGIQIVGDTLVNLTKDVMVQAFQRYKEKKHIFDDYDEYTRFEGLDPGVGVQFALVFESIANTVKEGALALGIPLDIIEERIASFQVATQTISLMDLSGDEVEEELLAIFSTIFDDLAQHVVPYIADFQKVGEGLGETLVRVATSIQVFEEAMDALGFTFDAVDPETFATAAVDLVELVGGVDVFIAQFSTFFDKFADDERKLAFATDQLSRAFDSVGLVIPDTRDGMIELMMSLDATTEEGRKQIAMLLELAGVADQYYDLLEDSQDGLVVSLEDTARAVEIFQHALDSLDFMVAIDAEIDPELFTQIAVGLIEMAGGLEMFETQVATFFDLFATEEQKLDAITGELARAFEEVGLAIPATRDGMMDLMKTLDATTEEGQAQIAMLLRIAPLASQYFDIMEDGTYQLSDAAGTFGMSVADAIGAIQSFTGAGVTGQLAQLRSGFTAAMEAARLLNATQLEYAYITRSLALQMKSLVASLKISVLSMTQSLFGSTGLDTIFESDSGGTSPVTDPVVEGLEEVNMVANEVFTEWQNALESIFDYTQSLLLDDNLTTLTPAEQLAEAQSQFDAVLARARAGDVDAAAELPAAAQALLEEARFMYASGQQYTDIFDATLAALNSINIPSNVPEFIAEPVDNSDIGGGPLPLPAPLPVEEPVSESDAMIAALERYLLAVQLSEALRELAMALEVSVIDLATELGVPLRELAEILGVNLDPMDETTAAAIGEMAQLLGANVFELMEAIGVNLNDLAVATGIFIEELSQELAQQLGDFALTLGVNVFELADALGVSIDDLAETFGIGIDQFTAEQFTALVAFGDALGVGVSDIAAALDINLGEIVDATSLLSQALDMEISNLPPEIQDELGPLLTAIREATTEADANAAIDDLGKYILDLPEDISGGLIPFLDAMGFQNIAPELKAIMDIERNTRDTVAAIEALDLSVNVTVEQTVASETEVAGSYGSGGYVPNDGLYQLHAGEFVIDRQQDTITPVIDIGDGRTRPFDDGGNAGFVEQRTYNETKEVKLTLVELRDLFRRYMEQDLAASRELGNEMKQQTENQRRAVNG